MWEGQRQDTDGSRWQPLWLCWGWRRGRRWLMERSKLRQIKNVRSPSAWTAIISRKCRRVNRSRSPQNMKKAKDMRSCRNWRLQLISIRWRRWMSAVHTKHSGAIPHCMIFWQRIWQKSVLQLQRQNGWRWQRKLRQEWKKAEDGEPVYEQLH